MKGLLIFNVLFKKRIYLVYLPIPNIWGVQAESINGKDGQSRLLLIGNRL